MTSKDKNDGEVSPEAAAAYRDRIAMHERIRAGHLPDIDQLRQGAPFFSGDMAQDYIVWCDSWLFGTEIENWQKALTTVDNGLLLRPIIQNLRDVGTGDAFKTVEHVLRLVSHDDDADRMLVYLACMGDEDARRKLVASTKRSDSWQHDDYDRAFVTATALGMLGGYRKSMDAYCKHGLKLIERDADAIKRFDAARDAEAADVGQGDIAAIEAAKVTSLLQKIVDHDVETEPASTPALSRVVVPKLPEIASGHRRDLQKSWKGLDGEALPIVARGDVAAHRRALIAAWPHAAEIIDIVLGDLAAREEVRFRPTLFLGPAGTGKSSLARAICDTVRLPCELYNLAGMADSSLGGTSAQWSTAREAVPLQLVKRSKMASVAVIWDEIEKADGGKNNGSAMDALLPMLEPDQARHFRDLTLEVECDLSMVSHFATANSLEGIPRPLIDRMRVLTMPEPTWQHLGTLTRQIVDRIAQERGVDPRWFAPLAEDEMDLVKATWPGGSIRQLTRIVQTLIDGRDQLMGRC